MIQVYPNPLEVTGLKFFNQDIRNSPISTYSYISSIDFEVSIHDSGTNNFSSAFVYRCGDASAWMPFNSPQSVYGTGVTGAANYQFSPWKSNGTPYGGEVRFNYLNFGTDSEVKVRVKSKKGNINSADIGPYKKNFNSKWSNVAPDTIEISGINTYDKLIVVTNNELSTPLYLFANPIDIVSPTSVNLYLSAGIWEASAVNSNLGLDLQPSSNFRLNLTSNWTVYLAPGCYLDGTLGVRECSNVYIFGNGVIDAGRPYVNNWWTTVGFLTSVYDELKLPRSPILAFSAFYPKDDAYGVVQRTKNIQLSDVTIVNSIIYANTCAFKKVDNAKLISLWPNCDGIHAYDVSNPDSTKSSIISRTFMQTGDDTTFPEGSGKNILSSCYLVTLAGTTFRTYQGFDNYLDSRNINGMGYSAIDIDVRSYAVPGYYQLSKPLHEAFSNAIFGLLQTEKKKDWVVYSDRHKYKSITNLFFSGIRVENFLDIPLFDVGIKSYAESPGFGYTEYDFSPTFGNISSIVFKDITASSHPNSRYKWAKESKIFADEKDYRVHDVSFINVSIDNIPITSVNKNNYIKWYNKPGILDYDPTAPSYIGSSIVDVYCLIGDSIADGIDSKYSQRFGTNYSALPSEITGCYTWVPYQYNGFTGTWTGPRFEVMRPGVNTLNNFFFPNAANHVTGTASLDNLLAWKLRQISGDRDIYFVKFAQGGSMALSGTSATFTPMGGYAPPDWSISSTGEMFVNFSSTITSALVNLKNQFKMPEFKGAIICLGTNVPIETANYLVTGYGPTGNEVTAINPYLNATGINSKIETDLSSLVSGIRAIIGKYPSPQVDVYYSNIIWALPIYDTLGSYFLNYDTNVYNSYFQKFRNKINSLSSVIPPSSCNVSLNAIGYVSPTGTQYRADFVHYNFSGIAKMSDDIYGILQQETSSVTDPYLNPDVNYYFSLSNGMKNWVKITNDWKEADVWVKKNGQWKFSTPYVKTNSSWGTEIPTIELYSPGVESLRSSNYGVEVFNGSNYDSAYVFSGARTAVAAYGLDNVTGAVTPANPYKNKLWVAGSKPVLSYLTFGTDRTTNVRISKPGTSITSIDIRPRSKGIPYTISGGKAIIEMSPGDKAWVTINNEVSSPLFVFADNLKPPIPTTGNYKYFGPGIHELSALYPYTNRTFVSKADGVSTKTIRGLGFSSLDGYVEGQPYTIYLDGGAYVKGTFDIRNRNNLSIIGPGILAGDPINGEDFIDYDYFRTYLDRVNASLMMIRCNTTYDEQKGEWTDYSSEVGYPNASAYNFAGIPSGVIVSGITVVNSPWFTIKGPNHVKGVKVLSPWMFSTDGPSVMPDRKTKFASYTDSFTFLADDSIFTTPNAKSYNPKIPNNSGSSITSGIAAYSVNNGPIVLQYRSYFYFNQPDKTYQCLIHDIDVGSYSRNRDAETVIRATTDNLYGSDPRQLGLYDITLSNVRVEDPIDTALFWIGNIPDPFANGDLILGDAGNEYGSISGLLIADVTASGTNNQISGNPIWGKDTNNRPYNIELKNIKINNEYITESNKDNFIRWYREYDPNLINNYSRAGEVVDVYFYIGDSLAVGASGFGAQLTGTAYAGIADQVTGCYIYRTAPAWDAPTVTGTRFEIIRPGDNTWPIDYTLAGPDPYGNMSSESVLFHKLRGISNNRDIYVIKIAQGGTLAFSSTGAALFTAPDWSISSTGEMYSRFVLSATNAINVLRSSGKNPNLRGGVIFLGTNVPNYYNDRAFTSSIIKTEVSSFVYALDTLFRSTLDVATDYTNIIWVTPSKNIGDTISNYGYYLERVRAEVSSFENIYYKHHYYTPSAWDYVGSPYFADNVHPSTSGYIKIAEDLYNIFNANTSSVTNPALNPGVNITFVTGTP